VILNTDVCWHWFESLGGTAYRASSLISSNPVFRSKSLSSRLQISDQRNPIPKLIASIASSRLALVARAVAMSFWISAAVSKAW